jgi:hypothetical protein
MQEMPVVVSFYGGAAYYYGAAEKLEADCAQHCIDCDIVELALDEGESWPQICRRKIPFYREMQRKHRRPILWMDADCRLLRRPDFLRGGPADFGAFLRGFRYLRGFDPVALPRFFQPSILYFNHTPEAAAFLDLMCDLETASDASATDDYFLQEAWLRHQAELRLLIIPPLFVTFDLPAQGGEFFHFGRSGQVSRFKDVTLQHEADLLSRERRKSLLLHEASLLAKTGRVSDAIVLLRLAREVDPGDENLAYREARLLRREGRLFTALLRLRRFQGKEPRDNHAKRFAADSAFEARDPARAKSIAENLLETGTQGDRDWARSRLVRYGLSLRAKAAGLKPSQCPALWWMESPYPGNFGDAINPYIVEKLSGLPPRRVGKGRGLLAVGSVVKFATAESTVWGSGTPRMTDRLDPAAKYLAVRGPLTRQLVRDSGGECPEIYGDPSWFLPKLYHPKSPSRRYRLGLIRHFANEGDIAAAPDVKSISVLRASYDDIEAFVDEIHECEAVISTSLHGLIVCHAYGIPARWCEVTGGEQSIPGDGTKFRDYLLSVGVESAEPLRIPRGSMMTTDLTPLARFLPPRGIDLRALAAAAPFPVLPEVMARL